MALLDDEVGKLRDFYTALAEGKSEGDSDRVLAVLRESEGQWVPNLYRRTQCMVHSRIADLRKRGYRIESRCFGKSDWRYRLMPASPDGAPPEEVA
jgi:hypothetical protein